MDPNLNLSIVIPVYNSEATLAPLLDRLKTTLPAQAGLWEVILVDDGSRDQSWTVVSELALHHPFVHGIRLMRNYGQHNALLCGIRAARYNVVVTLDDDLQNPPEEIPRLLQELAKGYDVVYGSPKVEQHGVWRNLTSKLTKLVLQKAMGAKTAQSVSAFRAFRTALRDSFEAYRGPYPSLDVLLTWGARDFSAIKVQHDSRRAGQSNYTFRMLLRHAMNMMTGFSTIPLRLASLIGFLFTAIGGLLLAFVVIRYLIQGAAVPGFAFLVATVTILSGAQLFALGIIGEYLARIHLQMMDRPAYTVESRTCQKEAADGKR